MASDLGYVSLGCEKGTRAAEWALEQELKGVASLKGETLPFLPRMSLFSPKGSKPLLFNPIYFFVLPCAAWQSCSLPDKSFAESCWDQVDFLPLLSRGNSRVHLL